MPDIIISDIMMPQKNGIELLNELKNNISTSHIPIILLSAKSSIESKLEGMQYGADDYITSNHSIFRHDNFIGCFSADKIKMSARK